MKIALVDLYATHGGSVYHRATAAAKILWAATMIACAILANDWETALGLAAIALAVLLTVRAPASFSLALAFYPVVFALLFALAIWRGSFAYPATLLLRALTASSTLAALILTTPYPNLFHHLHRFMPRAVCEALFLTYRAIFILVETIENVFRSLYLRGGYGTGSLARNLRGGAVGLGVGFLRAIDLTERMNQVMVIRGYEDRLHGSLTERLSAADALPVLLAFVAIAFSVAMRLLGETAIAIALPAAVAVAAASGVVNYVSIQDRDS